MYGASAVLFLLGMIALGYALVLGRKTGFRLDQFWIWPLIALGLFAVGGLALLWPPALGLLLVPLPPAVYGLGRVLRAGRGFPDDGSAETLMVLGIERASGLLNARADAAAALLKARPKLSCVLSGGMGEAEGMAARLRDAGIDPARLILETRSRSTRENLEFSAALTDRNRPVLILTHRFHARRAALLARALGYRSVGVHAVPAPMLFRPHYCLRELLVMVSEAMHGNFYLWRKL